MTRRIGAKIRENFGKKRNERSDKKTLLTRNKNGGLTPNPIASLSLFQHAVVRIICLERNQRWKVA